MSIRPSRRGFLGASLSAPAAFAAAPASADPGALPTRVLGRTGLKVTVLGFGCMTTSDPSVIERALDAGVTYFDTARGYQQGNNERMVGAALGARRKNIILSSKSQGKTAQALEEHLNTTLRELNTDYLDIWYLHAKSKPEDITDEMFAFQQKVKKEGKIRFAGVSTHAGHKELIPFLMERNLTDVILTSYNFTMDASMDDLVDKMAAANIGVVAMKVMAGGFRSVKPENPLYPKLKRDGAMAAMLKWAVRRPSIHTSIPGIMDLDQLDENYRAVCTPFREDDNRLLAKRLDMIGPLYCRMCGTCAGQCAKGLPVSDIIRYVSYAEGYGEFALGRESYMELPQELRQVSCADCDTCSVKCPNRVRVVDRVTKAQQWFA